MELRSIDELEVVEASKELSDEEEELITVRFLQTDVCGKHDCERPAFKPQYTIGTLNGEVQARREKSGGAGMGAAT
jgi:hypothetical protein